MNLKLRNTARNYFATCPEKFRIGIVKELQRKERPSYFDVGILYHLAQKVFSHPLNSAMSLTQRVDSATQAVANEVSASELALEIQDEALRLFKEYVRTYPDDPGCEIISVEQEMSVVLFDDDKLIVTYETTLDAIGRTKSSRLAIKEHKTTAGYGAVYSNYIKNSPQINGSAYVCETTLKDEVELAIIDYAVKTKQARIERDVVLLNKGRLQKWYEGALADATAIVSFLKVRGKDEPWVDNQYECWGIRSECPYTPLCWHGWNDTTLNLFVERPIGRPTQKLGG